MAARVRYGEGDWFAVPLRDGGFGIGVLARANRNGVLFGSFFGPKRSALPRSIPRRLVAGFRRSLTSSPTAARHLDPRRRVLSGADTSREVDRGYVFRR